MDVIKTDQNRQLGWLRQSFHRSEVIADVNQAVGARAEKRSVNKKRTPLQDGSESPVCIF